MADTERTAPTADEVDEDDSICKFLSQCAPHKLLESFSGNDFALRHPSRVSVQIFRDAHAVYECALMWQGSVLLMV